MAGASSPLMLTRRSVIKSLGLLGAGVVLGNAARVFGAEEKGSRWIMPDESAPHKRTWMAWGANRKIWGRQLLLEVQRNLAAIALAISKHEPVSMLVRESDLEAARKLMGDKVEWIVCEIDDIWIRDTGPVFVVSDQGAKAAVDFNFNGWGRKQTFRHDAKVAARVTRLAGVQGIQTPLVLEGGAIEVDGKGTAILTESCVLNKNRNLGWNKSDCERELGRVLGIEKILWLPGIKGRDITDGHTDFYARFARPGMVFAGYDPDPKSFDHAVTKQHLEILRSATDARDRKLEVVVLEAPSKVRRKFANEDFAAGYINFYVCNGAVLVPAFGDSRTDDSAARAIRSAFPGREVVPLDIDGLAAGGGGIHCATMQEPAT